MSVLTSHFMFIKNFQYVHEIYFSPILMTMCDIEIEIIVLLGCGFILSFSSLLIHGYNKIEDDATN